MDLDKSPMSPRSISKPHQWAIAIGWLGIAIVIVAFGRHASPTPLGMAVILPAVLVAMGAAASYARRWLAFRFFLPLGGLLLAGYAALLWLLADESTQSLWRHRASALVLIAFAVTSIWIGIKERR